MTDAVNSTFYIEAVEATTITLSKVGSPTVGTAKYGINNTSPSTDYTYGDSISLSAGQKCYWTITSTTTAFTLSKYLNFTSTGKIKAGGNLSSLIGGQNSLPRNYCFVYLFRDCTKLVDASAINFGSITSFNSKTYAYAYMFRGCTSLTSAPELPVTTLASGCYSSMFQNCTSLTSVPELPATTLANYCCQYMFRNCTGLTSAPELPATTLAQYCYRNMFSGCTGIKLSETQTGIYQKPYRIPKEGTGTTASNALTSMFSSTGGTFTGTPTINRKYYVPAVLEYEITIPASISLNSGSSIPLTYEISGGSIGVSIASANSWKLKNGSSQISYSLNKTAWTMAEGTGTENLTLTSSGVPTATGAHTDILTFTYGGV